jgi:hypothetical protein
LFYLLNPGFDGGYELFQSFGSIFGLTKTMRLKFLCLLGPKTEDGRPKRPIITYPPIIFLALLPIGKVADNHIFLSKKGVFEKLKGMLRVSSLKLQALKA